VVVPKHIGHVHQVDLTAAVLLDVVVHFEALPLVYGLPVYPTHPVLPKVLLEVELNHPVLLLLCVLEPLEVNPHLLLLTELQVLYYITLLVLRGLLQAEAGGEGDHVEDARLEIAREHLGKVQVLLLPPARLDE
jgi:hypothetical protein